MLGKLAQRVRQSGRGIEGVLSLRVSMDHGGGSPVCVPEGRQRDRETVFRCSLLVTHDLIIQVPV